MCGKYTKTKGPLFKVKWKGFGIKHATWEPFGNLNKVLQTEVLDKRVRMINKSSSGMNIYANTPEVREYLLKWGLQE